MTIKSYPQVLALGVALSLLALPTLAQETAAPTSSGSVTVGAQGGDGIDTSSKLQQYETVPTGVYLPSANFSWKNASDYFIDFKGTKLGLDDQYASLITGKKGSFKLNLSWDQNPNWFSNTARTPYTETSPGVFHVPDGMRLALQNVYVPWIPATATNPIGTGTAPANPTVPNFFAVEPWVSQSQPIDIEYLRKTGRAALTFKSGENLNFNLSYSREQRDGNKNMTFYGGPNYEIAAPIAYRTNDFRAEAEYSKGRVFADVAANFSRFVNNVPYATIDNPERLQLTSPITGRTVINDVDTFRLWLPPDNKAYSVDFAGGVTFPKRHKLTVSASVGSMSMDRDLLPLATNPALATSATAPDRAFTINPPYSSVSAKYDTFMGAVKFTGDPHAKFGYSITARRFQLKDKTDEYEFLSSVRGDVGPSQRVEGGVGEAGALIREHEGYDTKTLRGEVHVLPVNGLRLAVGYGLERRAFDAREFEDVDDKNLTVTADYSRPKYALHGSFTNLKRTPGTGNAAAIQPTWQGATQQDITERNRNSFSGMVTLMPIETVSIALSGMRQTNDFLESTTGLLDQTFNQFGVDVTYAKTDKVSLTAGYIFEKYYFNMAAAYIPRGLNPPFDPANLWANATTDKVNTLRAGFKWAAVPDKLDVNLDFDYTMPHSDSAYDFTLPGTPIGGLNEANGIFPANVPALAGFPVTRFDSFPRVSKDFYIAKLNFSYHIAKNLTASALYWKQKFDNLDWQTQSMLPYMGHVDPGANRWFFLGATVPSYDANIARVSLTYTF